MKTNFASEPIIPIGPCKGLSKLEFAAITIYAGSTFSSQQTEEERIKDAIREAKALLIRIEKEG